MPSKYVFLPLTKDLRLYHSRGTHSTPLVSKTRKCFVPASAPSITPGYSIRGEIKSKRGPQERPFFVSKSFVIFVIL